MVNSTYLRELEAAAAAANVSINNSSDLYHKYDHASSTTHDDDDVRIASKWNKKHSYSLEKRALLLLTVFFFGVGCSLRLRVAVMCDQTNDSIS